MKIIRVDVLDENQTLIAQSTFEDEAVADQWIAEQEALDGAWPTPHTVNKVDVTAAVEESQKLAKAARARHIGNQVLDLVWATNDSKGLSGDQLVQLLGDPTLQMIERLLERGALATARAQIQGLSSQIYTDADKAVLTGFIDQNPVE